VQLTILARSCPAIDGAASAAASALATNASSISAPAMKQEEPIDALFRRIAAIEARDPLDRGREQGRVLGISLHPFLMGTPHRIGHLAKTLEYIAGHSTAWFARGMDVLDAYRACVEMHRKA